MPPPLPTFPSKGKMGRKGLTSSHWPQVDATALRREGRTQEKPQVSLLVKGKGRGSLPGVPPGKLPRLAQTRPGLQVGAPAPAGGHPGCGAAAAAAAASWRQQQLSGRGEARRWLALACTTPAAAGCPWAPQSGPQT